MKESINEFVRAYVLPTALVGTSLVLLANVGVHVVRAHNIKTDESPKYQIEAHFSTLTKRTFEFLGPYTCRFGQYIFSGDGEKRIKPELQEKWDEFIDLLSEKGYFPSDDAITHLQAFNNERGFDLGVVKGEDQYILTYRTADAPKPFGQGFTLIERGTNQSVKERFGDDYSPQPGEMNYFVMTPEGLIDYVFTLYPGSTNCIAMKPQQLIFRAWLQGDPWETLVFAQTQKSVARKLEDIARNPNRELLRPIN